jgi:methionyl-tRNA synthetase
VQHFWVRHDLSTRFFHRRLLTSFIPITVQKTLDKAGFIYRGSHSGWYAVSDECFYTEGQIEDRVNEVTGVTEKVSLLHELIDCCIGS